MLKGKRVIAKAIVEGSYSTPHDEHNKWELYGNPGNSSQPYRSIYRQEREVTGTCLGKSYLWEGYYHPGGNEYVGYGAVLGLQSAEFSPTKYHAVYVIEPDGIEKDRYYKPVRALVEDVKNE